MRPCPSIPNLKHAYKQYKTITSHNSEHNKRFNKKQIPKLLMSFGDGKTWGSVLRHGKSDSHPSRSNYIKLKQLKD